jgi:hypothetical protein
MILLDFFDFYRAQFEQAFNNIPNEGILSTIYLIGNFILLVFSGLFGGGGQGFLGGIN